MGERKKIAVATSGGRGEDATEKRFPPKPAGSREGWSEARRRTEGTNGVPAARGPARERSKERVRRRRREELGLELTGPHAPVYIGGRETYRTSGVNRTSGT